VVLLFAIYVALCLLVGWLGRDRAIGFAGFLVLSLLLNPLIALLLLVVSAPRRASLAKRQAR
jgi:hypothetical protein